MHRWLAVLVVATVMLPGVAKAASTQTVVCLEWGYMYEVPRSWQSLPLQCPDSGYLSSDKAVSIAAFAEIHGWWSDARSKSSITEDMNKMGKPAYAIFWGAQTRDTHRWVVGAVQMTLKNGTTPFVVEQETYAKGRMYKLIALFFPAPNNAVTSSRAKLAGGVIATFMIF